LCRLRRLSRWWLRRLCRLRRLSRWWLRCRSRICPFLTLWLVPLLVTDVLIPSGVIAIIIARILILVSIRLFFPVFCIPIIIVGCLQKSFEEVTRTVSVQRLCQYHRRSNSELGRLADLCPADS
jgi:hypothetical protein